MITLPEAFKKRMKELFKDEYDPVVWPKGRIHTTGR